MMASSRASRAVPAMLVAAVLGCGGGDEAARPVATPSVTVSPGEAALGSVVEMRYRFIVAPDAPTFGEDYWVFVHFLDSDGELMWTDDHQPAVPTRSWTPGAAIEYSRTMFIPKFPYAGPTVVELGLFSPESGERLPLDADTNGQRAYIVASFDLAPPDQARSVVFRDGWHPTEVADDELGTEWQWSKQEASFAFRNPKGASVFYLQLDQPVKALAEPQQVEMRIGGAVVDRFTVDVGSRDVRRLPLTPAQLGDRDIVELRMTVDRTFVPADIPGLRSGDTRELGVRVFRAHVEPQ